MPNTFNADGKSDAMGMQDHLAYLKATGESISGNTRSTEPVEVAQAPIKYVDRDAAAQYERRTAQEDAERRAQNAAPKQRKTSFGLPMSPK